MTETARILIADDDETFRESTAELLRQQGYQCDCVPDAAKAVEMLGRNEYDLMICDIKMPGNPQLELIHRMPDIAEGVPVILVTGYPVLESAIQSIELPVEAYLVKPLDFGQLLEHVNTSVKHSQLYRSVRTIKRRLQYWYEGLASIEQLLKEPGQKGLSVSLDTFLELTSQNITGAVSDLTHLTRGLAGQTEDKTSCHLLNCPRLSSLLESLAETVEVLEKSKRAFKSKDLGQMRRKLQEVVSKKYKKVDDSLCPKQ